MGDFCGPSQPELAARGVDLLNLGNDFSSHYQGLTPIGEGIAAMFESRVVAPLALFQS
jgi:hypothetical protein